MSEQKQDNEELSKVLALSRSGTNYKQIASVLGVSEARVWELIKSAQAQPLASEFSAASVEPISAMFVKKRRARQSAYDDIVPLVAKLEPDQCMRFLYPVSSKRRAWMEGLRSALKKNNIEITTRTTADVVWIARASKL